ncbi:MAG: ABC1 kinase family protein [Armatimonadota bacterium]
MLPLGKGRDITRRALNVGRVATKYGFGYAAAQAGLARFIPHRKKSGVVPEDAALADSVRMRMALEELGPTFVKLGQALAARPDLIPDQYVREFSRLHDEVPPFPFHQVEEIITQELGRGVEDLFQTFGTEPAASASIGQVHHAVLKSGELVAVKVQRPGVADVIETDLQILRLFAHMAERRFRWAERAELSSLVEEFAEMLQGELDYTQEGHNADRLRQNLAEQDGIYVPAVYWSLTTPRVLTWERIEGVKLTDDEALDAAGARRPPLAERLAECMLRQILIQGYFHGDPHPGNVMLTKDGRIAFMDFGSMGWLGRELREDLVRLVSGMIDEDAGVVAEQLAIIGVASDETDMQALEREIDGLLPQLRHMTPGELRLGRILHRIMELVFRYRIKMPSDFALLVRALALTEGLCLKLDPEFDFRQTLAPVARDMLGPSSPADIVDSVLRTGRDIRRYAKQLPRQMARILSKAESGRLKMRVEYDRLEEPLGRLDVMANRLAYSLIVAAILIASALVSQVDVVVLGARVPVGVIGFLFAAVLGVWLLYSIFRSGRL